jgi:membrane-bound lytic murein transglycosylase B
MFRQPAVRAFVLFLALVSPGVAIAGEDFPTWLAGVRAEAQALGVREATLDKALTGIEPIPRVIELDRKQPEFTLTFKKYLERVVNDRRARLGRAKLVEHRELLEAVSRKYKVQPRFIIALWGIETDFGRITGGFPVVASLATLAHDGRRSKFFRKELMLALQIIDQGHISAKKMIGSWAGAMGQNQFMPSSFHAYAVDYDGDGNKDIWGTLPDVFASIANYLSKSGWRDDQTWGRAATVPADFKAALTGRKLRKRLSEWQALGVRQADGSALPSRDLEASVVSPEKNSLRPVYIAYHNYRVILRWNRSDYFAIAVGTLSDRLR